MSSLSEFWNGFKKGSKKFGHGISTIVNTILLIMVYIIGVGITKAMAITVNKKFMDLSLDKNLQTYWSELNHKKKTIEDYQRPY